MLSKRRTSDEGSSRRQFLRTTIAAAGVAGAASLGRVSAQSQETIRLGGEIDGWQGRAPDSIAGETNPTLSLDPGTDYRLVWENLDGQGHNVALLDADENVLQRTDIMSEEGATQTVEFTASEEMAEYVCEPHITSMRGTIEVGGGSSTQASATDSEDEEATAASVVSEGPTVRIETIVDGGPTAPLDFEVPTNRDGRYYITDRLGQVYVYDGGGLRDEPFVDVGDRLAEISGEMGLLGMALHPNYGENRKFYLRYSAPRREGTPEEFDHTEVLSEFTAADDGLTADADSERTVMEFPSPYDTHNSGAIAFGPDNGYLYVGMGDGGGGFDVGLGHVADWYERFDGGEGPDVSGNGQDVTENLLGSILRIDVDTQEGEQAYGIPEDNPLVGQEGLDEHFAWGFRNPWRMGFSNGELYAADVGQSLYEEVNHVQKGNNYGWNVREGTGCFEPGPEESRDPPDSCPTHTPDSVRGGEPLVDPVIEYPHSVNDDSIGVAAVGGYLYTNDAIPAIQGAFVLGDYRLPGADSGPTGRLMAATPTEEGQWPLRELRVENTDSHRLPGSILTLGRDNANRLYVLTTAEPAEGETGAVHRIVPPESANQASANASAANTTAGGTNVSGSTAVEATGTNTGAATTSAGTTGAATSTGVTSAATETGMASGSGSAADANASGAETGGETTSTNGPGFGVVAGVAGLAAVAARRLLGDD